MTVEIREEGKTNSLANALHRATALQELTIYRLNLSLFDHLPSIVNISTLHLLCRGLSERRLAKLPEVPDLARCGS